MLLMSTGFTFGSISALFGLNNRIIDQRCRLELTRFGGSHVEGAPVPSAQRLSAHQCACRHPARLCFTQVEIDWAVAELTRQLFGVRPDRTRSTICRRFLGSWDLIRRLDSDRPIRSHP